MTAIAAAAPACEFDVVPCNDGILQIRQSAIHADRLLSNGSVVFEMTRLRLHASPVERNLKFGCWRIDH
jgi:hypothetical protein